MLAGLAADGRTHASPPLGRSRATGTCRERPRDAAGADSLDPLAHAWRTAWSGSGRPYVERFLGPVDVLHFSDWMTATAKARHDHPRPQPDSLPGQRSGRAACTAASTKTPRARVTWSSSTPASQERTCVERFPGSCSSGSASPADHPRFCADGERTNLGALYRACSRSHRSAQNLAKRPPRPLDRLRRLHPEFVLSPSWGSPTSQLREGPAVGVRLGRGTRAALPGRSGLRLPVAVRGIRATDRRGDGLRHTRRRIVSSIPRRRPGTPHYGPTPTAQLSWRGAGSGDRRPRRAHDSGSRTRFAIHAGSVWGRCPRGLRGWASTSVHRRPSEDA